MKQNHLKTPFLLILIFLGASNIIAQNNLEIFGFYQSRLTKSNISVKAEGDIPSEAGTQRVIFFEDEQNYLAPFLQQLNLLVRKELTNNFTAFLNFEFINNFSTEKNWGQFNVEEAWLDYEYSPAFNIKAGWLVPKFNNLNEIKNRMPLLPYINRPMIYETSLRGIIETSDYLPERAFFQVYGSTSSEELEFNYAAYVGPAEANYTVTGSNFEGNISGADTSDFKLFGGRLGVNYNTLRFGISSSTDRHNNRSHVGSEFGEDLRRIRLGFDLGFSLYNFYFDAEFIKVMLSPKKTSGKIDKIFYYGTLEYDFTDQIYAYGSYSYLEDKVDGFFSDGFYEIMAGGGYRITSEIVLKLQYENLFTGDNVMLTIDSDLPKANAKIKVSNVSVAFSILF